MKEEQVLLTHMVKRSIPMLICLPSVPDLPVPLSPAGFAYSNKLGSNSGYVMLNWDKINGATGYKVWIFNGSYYEPFDIGDVDNWTT